jgi:hypothetical protein
MRRRLRRDRLQIKTCIGTTAVPGINPAPQDGLRDAGGGVVI